MGKESWKSYFCSWSLSCLPWRSSAWALTRPTTTTTNHTLNLVLIIQLLCKGLTNKLYLMEGLTTGPAPCGFPHSRSILTVYEYNTAHGARGLVTAARAGVGCGLVGWLLGTGRRRRAGEQPEDIFQLELPPLPSQ